MAIIPCPGSPPAGGPPGAFLPACPPVCPPACPPAGCRSPAWGWAPTRC